MLCGHYLKVTTILKKKKKKKKKETKLLQLLYILIYSKVTLHKKDSKRPMQSI